MRCSAWRKQTDVLKQVHITAALIALYGERATFVDGRISHALIGEAVRSGNVKAFFNRRFHDKGVAWQRLVYFQTVSSKRMGDRKPRRGLANLHFHALIIRPERQSNRQIRESLADVFGRAQGMRIDTQFCLKPADWEKSCCFKGFTASGPIGKLFYIQAGMAGTYNDLKLNADGKRSRRAPLERLRCNRHSLGLARGIPSHFNAKATLCDHASTKAGRHAFERWISDPLLRCAIPTQTKAETTIEHRAA